MTDHIHANPAPLHRRVVLGIVLALAALLVIPAAGHAAGSKKFGAALNTGAKPVQTPVQCINPNAACTHVPVFYESPPHAGGTPFAPKDGTITKIKLRSKNSGSLRVQLARQKGSAPAFLAKIQEQGPKIRYDGTGKVETFDVNIPVKQGQWLALKAKNLGAMSCNEFDYENDAVYQPPLQIGDPFSMPHDYYSCTPLVQAVMH